MKQSTYGNGTAAVGKAYRGEDSVSKTITQLAHPELERLTQRRSGNQGGNNGALYGAAGLAGAGTAAGGLRATGRAKASLRGLKGEVDAATASRDKAFHADQANVARQGALRSDKATIQRTYAESYRDMPNQVKNAHQSTVSRKRRVLGANTSSNLAEMRGKIRSNKKAMAGSDKAVRAATGRLGTAQGYLKGAKPGLNAKIRRGRAGAALGLAGMGAAAVGYEHSRSKRG